MVTNGYRARVLLAAAVFACVGGVARDASALEQNVPYVVSGQTLVAENGTSADATVFNNAAYIAYIRTDSSIGIVVDSALGNGRNAITYGLPGPARLGTALLAFNGTLYLFWIGSNDGYLKMQRSTNGTTWDGPFDLYDPAISYPGYGWSWATAPIAVAWDGQPLIYLSFSAGVPFLVQFNVSGTSISGPYFPGNSVYPSTSSPASATIWQGALYLAWVDANNGNQIGLMHYTDSAGWSAETLTGKTGVASLYPLDAGALQMVNRGDDSHIYYTWTTDGASFGTSYEDAASTTNHQAVQFTDYSLSANWVFYVGQNSALYTVLE